MSHFCNAWSEETSLPEKRFHDLPSTRFPASESNMPPIQAYLFDLDGTLIDSLADIAKSVNRMLEARGHPRRDLELFRKMVGDGMDKLVERALPNHARDAETIKAGVAEYRSNYESQWQESTRPYEGVIELLQCLKNRGLKLGVISNKAHRFTVPMTEYFFGKSLFDVILGARPEIPNKPAPNAAHEVAAIWGISTSSIAYVGDSGIDMDFARNSGMWAIGVCWGFRGEKELRDHGADLLITHPSELTT